ARPILTRHFDAKVSAALGTDEVDQVAGIAEVAVAGHARGQVAAQRDEALAPHRPVLFEQGADLFARTPHAGKVRSGVESMHIAQAPDRFGRIAERGTPGAKR